MSKAAISVMFHGGSNMEIATEFVEGYITAYFSEKEAQDLAELDPACKEQAIRRVAVALDELEQEK